MDTFNAIPRRAHLQLFVGIVLLATMLCACKKSEPPPTTADRLKYVEKGQETQPDFHLPRKPVDYMKDLKAIKDSNGKPAAAAAASAPAAVESKPAIAETKTVAAPVAAPPAVVATPVTAPTPAPVALAPAAPPPTVVASAPPSARPTPAREIPPALTVLVREPPAFPREAARDGVTGGNVRARLLINAEGNVTSVVILEAVPPRVFDRSVNQALSRWKFNAGSDGRTYETNVEFKS